jgi:hypothetical protein
MRGASVGHRACVACRPPRPRASHARRRRAVPFAPTAKGRCRGRGRGGGDVGWGGAGAWARRVDARPRNNCHQLCWQPHVPPSTRVRGTRADSTLRRVPPGGAAGRRRGAARTARHRCPLALRRRACCGAARAAAAPLWRAAVCCRCASRARSVALRASEQRVAACCSHACVPALAGCCCSPASSPARALLCRTASTRTAPGAQRLHRCRCDGARLHAQGFDSPAPLLLQARGRPPQRDQRQPIRRHCGARHALPATPRML